MLSFLAVLVTTLPILLTTAFAVEVSAGLARGGAARRASPDASEPSPEGVIVMPAHDEAAVIGDTLRRLQAALGPGMRVLVVADNSHDATAPIARAHGAEVIERFEPDRKGKGYALAFARDHLAKAPPPCVVVLDADCETDGRSLARLMDVAMRRGRPVQAAYLLRPDAHASPMLQVSNFAFFVRNLIRQRGLARIAGHVHLTGTGMAFPWPLFAAAPLATADIVEDLGLGLDMTLAGTAPLFAADATVWSAASSAAGTLKQRTRWEGGFLSTARRRAVPMIARALRKRDPGLSWAGLSLAVPPLALLVMLDAVAFIAAVLLYAAGASPVPAALLAIAGTAAALGVAAAWRTSGRAFLSGRAAARLPLYLFWKLPLYAGLLSRKERTWLRPGR